MNKSWITNPRGQNDSYKKAAKKDLQKQKSDEIKHDLLLPRGETKVLRATDMEDGPSYDRGLFVKLLDDGGYEVAYWYNTLNEIYPIEILVDGESVKKDAKKVTFKFHPELEKLLKENGGGGGAATSGSFGGGAGTVFTSQDTGVFTPSYGGRSERKKRWDKNRKGKKRSGVERLGLFITDQSPERKMQKELTSSTVDLIKWVQDELKKDDVKFRQQTSSTSMNDQTKQTDGLRNPVLYDAEPDKEADVAQKDVEDRIRSLDDSENIKNNKADEKGDAGQVAPAGLSVQLSYGSGTETGPTVAGGYRDLDAGKIDAEEEDDKDSPFV
jgi:hypothetical protein